MTDNHKGILAIVGSSTAFVFADALTKLATAELPIGELIVIRGVMASLLTGIVAWWYGALRPLTVLAEPALVVRILAAGCSTMFIVLSLKYLPLAIVNSLLQMTPLAVTACAALWLGEPVGWRRWAAAFIGFLGVLLIVQPGPLGGGSGSAEIAAYAWLALTALGLTTIRDLSTRMIDKSVPGMFVSTLSTILIVFVGLAFWPFETWVMPSSRAMLLLAGSAFFLLFAYNLVIYSMRTGEIAVVGPFRYTLVLLAIPMGYLLWGDIPNRMASLGIALIVSAGLYLLHRERVVARAGRGIALAPIDRPMT